jgi:hypothetical protein
MVGWDLGVGGSGPTGSGESTHRVFAADKR